MSQLIISVSGVRGVIGQGLDQQVAERLARVYAAIRGKPQLVLLARDGRPSGVGLARAVGKTLSECGSEVVDLGIVSTPGAALMTVKLKADGAIVITASHNPAQYNGLKFLGADGQGLAAEDMAALERKFKDESFEPLPGAKPGRIRQNDSTHEIHVGAVLAQIDRKAVGGRGFCVVLDSINGAGGTGGRMLLEKLGCEVVHINAQPTGEFAHAPEPIAQNLGGLCDVVRDNQADVGFAQDPDADRLAVVDETGRFIGEEYTLALAAMAMLSKRPGSVATNLSTSRMIDDVAKRFGVKVFRTPVGEAHVAKAARKHACVIAGEGNGGVIIPQVAAVRDSFSGMALILELLAKTGKTVSQLVEEIPRYVMLKTKLTCEPLRAQRVLEAVAKAFAGQQVDRSDGIRIDWPEGWVQIRRSNTEPIIRVFAEAAEKASAEQLLGRITDISEKIS